MDNPDKNFLIVYVLASHGIQSSGKQVVLLNEFHAGTGFYRAWGVENDIRDIAETFPNSYQIAFFACCRELWNSEDHGGCIGGTKEKAEAYYKELAAANAKANAEAEQEARCEALEKQLKETQEKIEQLHKAEHERLNKGKVTQHDISEIRTRSAPRA